ncbi:MAG: hypothetical protein P4L10_17635 [Acidobacteriaceae bacterium]|nr:hypothetical protein [Acidobacteriaceae bacterium]
MNRRISGWSIHKTSKGTGRQEIVLTILPQQILVKSLDVGILLQLLGHRRQHSLCIRNPVHVLESGSLAVVSFSELGLGLDGFLGVEDGLVELLVAVVCGGS